MPSRPLRGVAIVVHNFDALGGMERQAGRLAERLAERGVEVTIVTTKAEPPLSFPPRLESRCERRGRIEIVRVPAFGNWSQDAIRQLVDLVATWAIVRRRRRIDVVYAVQFSGGVHAALAARMAGLPVIVKFAGGGEYGDFRGLARQDDADRIRSALGGMDRYVIISEQIRKEAEEAGLERTRFVWIRNGVDTRAFSPEGPVAELPELGPAKDRKVVIFVGRLGPEKRIEVLLRAFARVRIEVPEARLALAGSGPQLDGLRALARELGIAGEVVFLGARPDVDALDRAASAFVLPSASEGLPNSLLEALACGTPCVATDIPGTRDVVTHEKEALLVPKDDEGALALALVRVLRDRELARKLAEAGRARVLAEFDMETVTERYVALFSELTRRAPAGGVAFHARLAWVLSWRLARLVPAVVAIETRDLITRVVVSAKRFLGIEGEILKRDRRSTDPGRVTELAPARRG